MYEYNAKLIRIIDGDTIVVTMDVGFNMTTKQHIRLLGINAPEKRGKTKQAGLDAKEHLITLLKNDDLVIKTRKNDSFGRYLGTIYLNGTDINQQMIDDGFAVEYMK